MHLPQTLMEINFIKVLFVSKIEVMEEVIEALCSEIKRLVQQNAELIDTIKQLTQEIALLKGGKNSHTSSTRACHKFCVNKLFVFPSVFHYQISQHVISYLVMN